MLNTVFSKNYSNIMAIFLSYLPSRFLVVFNSLIIVPVLAHLLTTNEIGIFQLSIGILNLVCTCSTDWIAKSALRFYERYSGSNKLDEFFSNLTILTLALYVIILFGFIFFSDFVTAKLFIPKSVLILTLFIVIPAGIRQFLYQMLRVLNRPFLYTFSIVLYQISLLALFLLCTGFMPNVFAVLTGMIIALIIIDIYIINQINFKIEFKFVINSSILADCLKYALPQIITNTSIWSILNINKFIFQYNHFFSDTAVAGVAWLLVTGLLTPVFSTFLFAVFPTIIQKFETKNRIKPFVTNTIQLYCALFIPIASLFCYYSKDLTRIAFSNKYPEAYILISFFAVVLFLHELMKLFNIKYHLKNKTYIEMSVSLLAALMCLNLNYILIPKLHLLGAGIAMLVSILLLFVFNLIIQFKDMDYVSYFRIAKTAAGSVLIGLFSFVFVELLFIPLNLVYFSILKMLLFIFFSYLISFLLAKRLLN